MLAAAVPDFVGDARRRPDGRHRAASILVLPSTWGGAAHACATPDTRILVKASQRPRQPIIAGYPATADGCAQYLARISMAVSIQAARLSLMCLYTLVLVEYGGSWAFTMDDSLVPDVPIVKSSNGFAPFVDCPPDESLRLWT